MTLNLTLDNELTLLNTAQICTVIPRDELIELVIFERAQAMHYKNELLQVLLVGFNEPLDDSYQPTKENIDELHNN